MAGTKKMRVTLSGLEEAERKLQNLSSLLEALSVAYGTKLISDGQMTGEIMDGLKEQVENILASLDDVGQAVLQEMAD